MKSARGPSSAVSRTLAAVLAIVAILTLAPAFRAAGRGEPGPIFEARVELADRQSDLQRLYDLDILIDGVFDGWARVYLVEKELRKLEANGFLVTILPQPPRERPAAVPESPPGGGSVPATYHTYATLTADMQAVAAAHPGITRLMSIGQTVQNREMWMMKISDNPDVEEDEPEFSYISSMHGDEVVGKELSYNLIVYLTDNYGTDPRVTDLIDNTEIWIMPSMNPDGTEMHQRWNANGFDLNRNFPDQFVDPVNTPDGRQAETQAVMNWMLDRRIVLAANMHGGELIVNYPMDSNPAGASVFSPAPDPDHDTFVSVSRSYADNNPPMFLVNGGPFDNGITNGADWYAINGGMQDWNYVWHGGMEVTLEVSSIKWPDASTLPGFWDDNLESMLAYMERVHEGVRGIVTDAVTGQPIQATIRIDANPFPAYTDADVGDYHRLLQPGTYSMTVSSGSYESQVVPIAIVGGAASRYDVALNPEPVDLRPIASLVDDGPGGDGWLDAAETSDLFLTLHNYGRLATSVSGRLILTGWYVDLPGPMATYPDIATAGQGVSNAPSYQLTPRADIPAGHKIGLALEWDTAEGGGMSEPFFLDVGAPSCGTVSATDLPMSINLTNPLVTSEIEVASALGIAEVRVTLDVSHSYIGDLEIDLQSPTGSTVRLHDRSGGSTSDIVGTYGVELTPAEPLSSLLDEVSGGTWTLTVHDRESNLSIGTFNSWSLEVCGRDVEATAPEMKFRELTRESASVRLDWWGYPGTQSYRVYRSADPSSAAAFVDVTAADADDTDTQFDDTSVDPLSYYLVTAVGANGEGPKGHFGE